MTPFGLMFRVCIGLLVFASAGCAAKPVRVGREIFGGSSFAISNSPMLVNPEQPRVDAGRVTATYTFLIESFAEYPQSAALGRATLSIAGRQPKIVCSVAGHALEELILEPRGRYRVDCAFGFTLTEVPLGKLGDAVARISIPLIVNGESDEATFSYYFWHEDAS